MKDSSLVHFDYFSLHAWFFGIIYLNFQKDSSQNDDFKTCEMKSTRENTQNFDTWT